MRVPLAKKDCDGFILAPLNDQYTDGEFRALMIRIGCHEEGERNKLERQKILVRATYYFHTSMSMVSVTYYFDLQFLEI